MEHFRIHGMEGFLQTICQSWRKLSLNRNILKALLPLLLAVAFGNRSVEAPRAITEPQRRFNALQQTPLREKPRRTRYTINDGWKFQRADKFQVELPAYDDASWNAVSLPHTWNVEDTLDDTPGYYRGVGWYRRSVRLEPHLRGKSLFLYFEGHFGTIALSVNVVQVPASDRKFV
jgi:hypothetical protein